MRGGCVCVCGEGDQSALFPQRGEDLFNAPPQFLCLQGARKGRMNWFNQDGDKMWKAADSAALQEGGSD